MGKKNLLGKEEKWGVFRGKMGVEDWLKHSN